MFAAIFVFFILITVSLLKIRKRNSKKYPKEYTPSTKTDYQLPEDILRDRFLLKKVPEKIDVIIIGSGVSGLTAGAFLSKIGKKVLIIEQHYVAGGNLHVFSDKGFEFETGLHYVNSSSRTTGILDLLGDKPVKWCQLGKEDPSKLIYDRSYIGDEYFDFVSGVENLKKSLKNRFPQDAQGIDNYFREIKSSEKIFSKYFILRVIKSDFLRKIAKFILNIFGKKFITTTTHEKISSFTKNRKLQAILSTQFGDYGIIPTEAPFAIHASVANHYLNGGHFPIGGPSEIAKQLCITIYKNGGRVLVGKRVKKILTESNKDVIGIEMETGDVIGCTKVISTVGYLNTFEKLIPTKESLLLTDLLKKKAPPNSYLSILFVGFNASIESLKLPSHNLWIYPNEYYEKWFPEFLKDPIGKPGFYFTGFGSSKDSDWSNRYPDKSSGVVITFLSRDIFEKWAHQEVRHRDQDYKDLKDKISKKMLEEGLFKFYPHLRDKIGYCDLGTPLSSEHFLGAYQGSVYGLDCTRERFTEVEELLKISTEYNGLYMSGQDIITPGIIPSLFSGILTCYHLLGYGGTWDLITGRDLIKDFLNLTKKNN